MRILLYILIWTIISFPVLGQSQTDMLQRDREFYQAIHKWFSAWKLVSSDIYKIDQVHPVEFVFFDDKNVYSTSTTTIKKGLPVHGANLMNLKLKWKKELHNDSLTLPDKSVVPIGLMSFASENTIDSSKSFFVMPLPGFWKAAGVESKELGLDNLVTSVFIHEFSHSQQMKNFGRKMTKFEQENKFDAEFNDDIIQNIFGSDTTYTKLYKREVAALFASVENNSLRKENLNDGLQLMGNRQTKYFINGYENLKVIDKFFLTMEGLGQYSMFLWLTNPKGGNIKRNVAIAGVRRGGSWWSQDEGFALFLILEQFTQPNKWVKDMFGKETGSVTSLIERFN